MGMHSVFGLSETISTETARGCVEDRSTFSTHLGWGQLVAAWTNPVLEQHIDKIVDHSFEIYRVRYIV